MKKRGRLLGRSAPSLFFSIPQSIRAFSSAPESRNHGALNVVSSCRRFFTLFLVVGGHGKRRDQRAEACAADAADGGNARGEGGTGGRSLSHRRGFIYLEIDEHALCRLEHEHVLCGV